MAVKIHCYNQVLRSEWDRMVLRIPGITFEYSTSMIDYRFLSSPYAKYNRSFIYEVDSIPVGVAVVFMEDQNEARTYSSSLEYLPAPYISKAIKLRNQEEILNKIMNLVFEYAEFDDVKEIKFRIDPLTNCKFDVKLYNYNFLMKYQFENTSINTQIIDLSLNVEELWSGIRKGHKHAINKGKQIYHCVFYDSSTISRPTFEIYKNMHFLAAGRLTRREETFWQMEEWIKNKNGLLCITYYNDIPVSCVLIYCFNETAYYASAAEDPSVILSTPVGHLTQWEIINYLKQNGINYYELGWQEFGMQRYSNPSEKELSIAFYKRGFGGETRALFRGIRKQMV